MTKPTAPSEAERAANEWATREATVSMSESFETRLQHARFTAFAGYLAGVAAHRERVLREIESIYDNGLMRTSIDPLGELRRRIDES